MTFRDVQLDPKISFGAVGGPGFKTEIAATESGDESRDATRAKELGEWDIAFAARLPEAYKPLQAFFRVVRGRADTWRFKDWSDFEVTSAQGVFTTLSSSTRQLWKRYTFGSLTYDYKVTLPVSGSITITGTGSYTVNYATGVLTISSGSAPTAWAGQFDRLCRFDTDVMRVNTIDKQRDGSLIIGWAGIPVKEVRA